MTSTTVGFSAEAVAADASVEEDGPALAALSEARRSSF